MATIVLKKKFSKMRDDAREMVKELQELRTKANGPDATADLKKKLADMEAKVAPVMGRTSWADRKDVEDHRIEAWVGADKPYELATDSPVAAVAQQAEKAADDAAKRVLAEAFYRVDEMSDAMLKFAYAAVGGKEKSVKRADAVKFVEDTLDALSLTD